MQHTIPEIASMLAERVESVVKLLLPNGVRDGHEWCVGSLAGETGQSLKVHLTGDKAGVWKDFANGETGGDLVDLWHIVRDIDKSEALREIRRYLGLKTSSAKLSVVPRRVASVKPLPQKDAGVTLTTVMKPISREYHQTLRSSLLKNAAAMAYLTGGKRGLTAATIEHFGLGLSGEYKRPDGKITAYAVVAPMLSPSTGQWLCVENGVSLSSTK